MPPRINLQENPKHQLKSTSMMCCRHIFFLARVSSYNLPAALILTFFLFLMTFNNSWRPNFADRVKGTNHIKEALVLCWSLSSYQVCECRSVILGLRKLRKDHRHYLEDRSGNAVSLRPSQTWIIPVLFICLIRNEMRYSTDRGLWETQMGQVNIHLLPAKAFKNISWNTSAL